MEGTCRVGEGSWLPLPLIVAAVVVVNNVLAVATGSPPSTCSLSLAIGVNETHKARCNIRCVQISHSDIAKRRRNESFSPGGDDHIPFLSLSCAGIRLCTATIKMGCTFLCVSRFDFFGHNPQGFYLSPIAAAEMRTPCLECWIFWFYAGAAPFTFQNRPGK